ncbi:MAG: DUF1217 domain-containing protein [Pseudomonadota bacterium]
MSFQPVIPAGGNVGWSFLVSSRATQQEAFNKSSQIANNTSYFAENIGSVTSAEDLVSDRRLLSVALGAFGLDEDINNRFFIQKVLQEGSLEEESFANRLSDKRYLAMAEAFGFDLSPPRTVLSDFSEPIIEQYQNRQFEISVGDQDENLRLALGISRDIEALASRSLNEDTSWFSIMGNPPMRRVFEQALGLPAEIAAIDIDQQLTEFRERSDRFFGTTDPADFAQPELQEKLVRSFLLQAELSASASAYTSGTVALSLLQSFSPFT